MFPFLRSAPPVFSRYHIPGLAGPQRRVATPKRTNPQSLNQGNARVLCPPSRSLGHRRGYSNPPALLSFLLRALEPPEPCPLKSIPVNNLRTGTVEPFSCDEH